MNSSDWGVTVLGIILLLAGATFSLQGANYLGGSAMTGSSFWLYAGVVIAVLGVVLLAVALLRNSRRPKITPAQNTQDPGPSSQ